MSFNPIVNLGAHAHAPKGSTTVNVKVNVKKAIKSPTLPNNPATVSGPTPSGTSGRGSIVGSGPMRSAMRGSKVVNPVATGPVVAKAKGVQPVKMSYRQLMGMKK